MIYSLRATQIEAARWDGTVDSLKALRKWYYGHGPRPEDPADAHAVLWGERRKGALEDGFSLEVGDWLCRDLDGEWGIMDDENFTNWYTASPTMETADADI